MDKTVVINTVPPSMPLRERVSAAWSVFKGRYTVSRSAGVDALLKALPCVAEVTFEGGYVVRLQCPEGVSAEACVIAARREILGTAAGDVVDVRVSRRG